MLFFVAYKMCNFTLKTQWRLRTFDHSELLDHAVNLI